jgi:hypothetical protein
VKKLLNEWRQYTKKVLAEEADPGHLDPKLFPLPLSKVQPARAKAMTQTGAPELDKKADDDIIPVNVGAQIAVGDLKPSQSSMNIGKAMGMVVSMLDPNTDFNPGGNLGAFISKDNYIMDGHHRWIATSMINPTLKVGGYQVGWPGQQLVPVLNAITKGKLGIMKGKPASGGFEQFQPEPVKKQLTVMAQQGNKGGGQSAEQVMDILQKFTGVEGPQAVEAAANKMSKNLSTIILKAPPWAPGREDMPVIDPDKVPGATKTAAVAMAKGEVDVNPPYGTAALVKKKKGTTPTKPTSLPG